ncbi:dipeptidase [Alistipes sp. ZOR0009]|uniref:dipeptidase n=1 Tax=Alistipes sp. ZOR0009 TaxID=1339253 RepID=UPI0006481B0B|nr:C69 family dipeptidase [Alistipes sp. ZOR0009]
MKIKVLSILLASSMLSSNLADACTNYIVTKGASKDGSCMLSYSADSHTLYGELYFYARGIHAPGTMRKIHEWDTGKYLGEIPEAGQTYQVVGNMNEHQLVIGESTWGGREELSDSTGLIDYGTLIYATLQRAKNAREAIKTMAELVEKYGYYSSGESISIVDPNEAWVFEIIGKGVNMVQDKKTGAKYNKNKGAVWVAVRIPDGFISGHANHARITKFPLEKGNKNSISSKNLKKIFEPQIEFVYAADVISFAREAKYFTGADAEFSFSDIYCPLDFGSARGCEARVWSFFREYTDMSAYQDYALGHNLKNRMPLYVKPDRKLTAQDVMHAMRNHYEGTVMDMTKDCGAGPFGSPYRWRPMTWKVDGNEYTNERATATQQTGWAYVAQCRSWLPDAIGGLYWFTVDDVANSVHTPIYVCTNQIPENYKVGNGSMVKYSPTSAFWLFNRVTNAVYSRYSYMFPDLQKVQQELENTYTANVAETDKKALELYKENPDKAVEFLTAFTNSTASNTFNRWKQLDEYLLVKFIDGNIKKEKDGKFETNGFDPNFPAFPLQPGYPEWWKRSVKDQAGDILKVVK